MHFLNFYKFPVSYKLRLDKCFSCSDKYKIKNLIHILPKLTALRYFKVYEISEFSGAKNKRFFNAGIEFLLLYFLEDGEIF